MESKLEYFKNWEWKRLGDVCAFIGGGTPSKSNSSFWGGSIFWASVKDIKGNYLLSTIDTITQDGLENSSTAIADVNEVILITRISPGKTIITKVKTAINQDLKIVRPKFDTFPKYLSYYLRSIEREIIKKSNGTTVLGITLNNLNEIEIPVLSIHTQTAIVSKIEELFSELDKGIENLRLAQQQLKVYRQSVLKRAFEGKLTNVNVKGGELPKSWKLNRLGNMFDFVGGGTPSKSEKDYWNGNVFWASVKDVKGDYLNKTQDTITEQGLKNSASNLAEPGDVILITRISPGKSIISNVKSAINQDLKIAKPKFKTTSKFINYFFNAIERDCIKNASGTTVLGITLKNLNQLTIPELNITEQNNLIQKIEIRLSVADKMEESITQSVQKAEVLRQSILKKAFEGKLIEFKN